MSYTRYTLYVALLAYLKKSDINSDTHIATKDWWFLFGALASIPIWYFTSDPLWAVIILTLVDVMGFGPTFRKAYHFPHQEQIRFFAIMVIRNAIAIAALENHSMTTILFPAATATGCLLLILLIGHRRTLVNPGTQAQASSPPGSLNL